MEAAVRWSPHATAARPQFLIIDVQSNRLELRELESLGPDGVKYRTISERNKLPNFTAFDWSKTSPYLVALGSQSGEANLVRINPDKHEDAIISFPVRHQRKCNSIAFSRSDYLATGLDRVRNDHCMNIYQIKGITKGSTSSKEPYLKYASSEPISSMKFFSKEPDVLVAGVTRQCVKIFDMRDNNPSGTHFFSTRQVHNLAIDPLDERYFVSAGPPGEPIVSVWDRRMSARLPSTPSTGPGPQGPILELRPAVENSNHANIWALRFSGTKRGAFSVLANTGELKLVEMVKHQKITGFNAIPGNEYGGTPWLYRQYIRRTHSLSKPWFESEHQTDGAKRVTGYDFVSAGICPNDLGVLTLHPDRSVGLIRVPEVPRQLSFTGLDELFTGTHIKQPTRSKTGSIAQDLLTIQGQARKAKGVIAKQEELRKNMEARLEDLSKENIGHKTPPSYETPLLSSSGDQHEQLLNLWFPDYRPAVGDALNIMRTQRRRCQEGYQLDVNRNKEIVANDPWLVDMWDTIKRFSDMSNNDGMVAGGLDLSYLGIQAVWTNTFGPHRNRNLDTRREINHQRSVDAVISIVGRKDYPPFSGHKTRFPAHRQLCLALCGWTFSRDRLKTFCTRLMENGAIYKAVVIAVMRGFKDLAQELLRSAIQQKKIENIGLGAVIACEYVNDEQRELCAWMADETDDPYLKALLNYFIKGDWKVVADMPQLALMDRVGVALKYIDDTRLSEFIKIKTKEAMLLGNIEGLVLTGLGSQALPLFSTYIRKFADLQTAVLALSFTNPLYVDDARFALWKETYMMQLQTWRLFSQRIRYLVAHAGVSKSRDLRPFATVDERPATLACPHCRAPLAQRTLRNNADGSVAIVPARPSKNASAALPTTTNASISTNTNNSVSAVTHNGQKCPHCARPSPYCGICNLPLSAPDPARLNAGSARKLAEGDDWIARQAVRCATCEHAFHGHHAREWFARFRTCPVPSCECVCASVH